jgi:hypothetical protein
MNIYDKNKYNEFNTILSGCNTILDAHYFAEIYVKYNPEMRTLVHSMINGKRYGYALSFKSMMSGIQLINSFIYKDEADEATDLYTKKTKDIIQLKTLKKISKNKIVRDDINIEKKNQKIQKNCPHCLHVSIYNNDKSYVICGYEDDHKGYDWKGCGKDWCFKCEKKLCKIWESDKLFLLLNRYHDESCCKTHACDNNENYLDNYCQCSNSNVTRFDLSSY